MYLYQLVHRNRRTSFEHGTYQAQSGNLRNHISAIISLYFFSAFSAFCALVMILLSIKIDWGVTEN